MQVFLMRSIAGGGKSAWIKKFEERNYQKGQRLIICSADHFHIKDGVYHYEQVNSKRAHDVCLETYLACLRDYPSTDYLFCDNTNTSVWEISPYYRLAELYDVSCTIIQIDCDFATACKRNVHNVPPATIWRMYQNILTEKLPSHWKVEIYTQEMLANM